MQGECLAVELEGGRGYDGRLYTKYSQVHRTGEGLPLWMATLPRQTMQNVRRQESQIISLLVVTVRANRHAGAEPISSRGLNDSGR